MGLLFCVLAGCGGPERLLNQGNLAYHQGRFEDAKIFYSKALEQGSSSEALYNLGVLANRQGEPTEAKKYLDRLLENYPGDPQAHYQRARAFLALEDSEAAYQDLLRATSLNSIFGPAWIEKAELEWTQGEKNEAFRSLARAATDGRTQGQALLLQGTWLVETGDQENGLRSLNEALKLMPHSTELHNQLAQALGQLGELEQSVQRLEVSLKLEPNQHQRRLILATTYKSLSKEALARKHLMQVAKQEEEMELAAQANQLLERWDGEAHE